VFAFKTAVVYYICTVGVHLVQWETAQGVEDHLVGFKIGSWVCFDCKLDWYSGNPCKVLQGIGRSSSGRVKQDKKTCMIFLLPYFFNFRAAFVPFSIRLSRTTC